jgi:hypothetical protein
MLYIICYILYIIYKIYIICYMLDIIYYRLYIIYYILYIICYILYFFIIYIYMLYNYIIYIWFSYQIYIYIHLARGSSQVCLITRGQYNPVHPSTNFQCWNQHGWSARDGTPRQCASKRIVFILSLGIASTWSSCYS